MTDEPEQKTTEPDETNSGIRQIVAEALGSLLGQGKAQVADDAGTTATKTTRDRSADIGSQVATALKKVKAEEANEERITKLVAEVDSLKAAQQKPPKVIRKIEKIMGWHDDND